MSALLKFILIVFSISLFIGSPYNAFAECSYWDSMIWDQANWYIDTDSDSDGTPDCDDNCPSDSEKIDPGTCGCGTADTDSDSDDIFDCEEIDIYGTLPNDDDSDDDGITDGEELAYWGDNWNTNYDSDSIANNLLDDDSDNDGHLDGEEIDAGYDPSDPFDQRRSAIMPLLLLLLLDK